MGNWVINTDLDGCGTEFNLDNDSEIIDFKNALTMAPEIKHGLVMTRQVSLDFQYRYDTSIDDISAEHHYWRLYLIRSFWKRRSHFRFDLFHRFRLCHAN